MGAACGVNLCCTSDSQEVSELLTVDNKVGLLLHSMIKLFIVRPSKLHSKRRPFLQTKHQQSYSIAGLFQRDCDPPSVGENALGAKYASSLHVWHQKWVQISMTNLLLGTSEQADEVFDGQNNAIEERGDVVFKNGAVYKGQWLG